MCRVQPELSVPGLRLGIGSCHRVTWTLGLGLTSPVPPPAAHTGTPLSYIIKRVLYEAVPCRRMNTATSLVTPSLILLGAHYSQAVTDGNYACVNSLDLNTFQQVGQQEYFAPPAYLVQTIPTTPRKVYKVTGTISAAFGLAAPICKCIRHRMASSYESAESNLLNRT